MNARRCFLFMTVFLLAGCFLQPRVDPESRPPDRVAPPVESAPSGPVGLHEAMARAVRRHLDERRTRMVRIGMDPGWSAVRYERLPEAARAAGYGDYRGEAAAIGPDIPDASRELAELWDVLDLGMLRATGGGSDLAREKALRNILSDVRHAYYRAAAGHKLEADTEMALRRADAAVRGSGGNADPVAHRALYERMRRLDRVVRELQPAPTELAMLMGWSARGSMEADSRDLEQPWMPRIDREKVGLAGLALRFRPEVKNRLHPDRRLRDARAALAELAPGLDREGADVREWWNAGARVALHLFHGGPGRPADPRFLDLGVLVQAELALLRYRLAEGNFENAKRREEAAVAMVRDPVSPLDEAARVLEVQLARANRYLAFGEWQNALARVYQSLGVDPLPVQADAMRVPELARALERSMARWGEALMAAYAAHGPESRLPRRLEAAAPDDPFGLSVGLSVESPTDDPTTTLPPLPVPAPEATSPRSESGTGASHFVRADESRGAREISIFRDVVTIHALPAPNAPVIGQGLIGERYPLLGWSRKGMGWLKIEMSDGTGGWVPTRYMRPVEPEGRIDPEAAGAPGRDPMAVITTTRANVRFGAGLQYQVRYTENEGVRLSVIDTRGEWYHVRTPDGEAGWLHESVVRVADGGV